MNKVSIKLQVFFQEPFWVGVCERTQENQLTVSRMIFGAEPKDYEVQEYLMQNWYELKFSPSVETCHKEKSHINPKRLQRNVKKQIETIGIGTKSQQALQLLHEQNKLVRKTHSREQKEEEKERLFILRQQKKKEKHKGR